MSGQVNARPIKATNGVASFDVFLSHRGQDKAAVERVAEKLKRHGLEPWLDRWCLTPGGDWQAEIAHGLRQSRACAVFVGPASVEGWEREEVRVALDRAANDREFRLFLVLLPGVPEPFDVGSLSPFLSTRTWVDLRAGLDSTQGVQGLLNAIKGVPLGPGVSIEPRQDLCPFRGLQVFTEADARFFFGRDADVQRLIEKLKTSLFLAIIGPSGSGKSSLARAGLVPALNRGALSESETWTTRILTPGTHPLDVLTAHLVQLSPHLTAHRTRDDLADDPRTLRLLVSERPASARVVWVVDQFEETFTLCRDDDERRSFILNLLFAASADGPSTVILTMRADFYPHCAAYPELAQQVAAQQFLVGPMEPDKLRQAIEEPARLVGLDFEAGLVNTILRDVQDQPGALPLLEHALLELWERRRGSMLTLEGYQESGGVAGALAKRAEAIFAEFTSDQQQIAQRVLLRLTQPGESTEDTKRRVVMGELITRPEALPAIEAVVRAMAEARLLTATASLTTGKQAVEVSHEALIRGWPRMRAWVEEDRQGLRIHHRLAEAAQEWEALGRDPDALYRGARLVTCEEWAGGHDSDLNDLEREFLAASRTRGVNELEVARRTARRFQRLALGLVALLIVAVVSTVISVQQTSRAEREERIATSRGLAAQAIALLERRPDLGIQLSLESYRIARIPEARGALVSAVQRSARMLAMLRGDGGAVSDVSFSPDGRTLASASDDGTVRFWDATRHALSGAPLQGHGKRRVWKANFSRDGRLLATSDSEGSIRLWDVTTRRPIGEPLRGHRGHVYTVLFSPDQRILASAGADRTIRLWDVAAREPLGQPLRGHRGEVLDVAFSPDGRTLASSSDDTTIRLWDLTRRQPRGGPLVGHAKRTLSLKFSPDGRTLASSSDDTTIRLWDLTRRQPVGVPLMGHREPVFSVAFSPDGRTLASAGFDRSILLWDVDAGRVSGQPLDGHADAVLSLDFSPDGNTLASSGSDGTIVLWDATRRQALGTVLHGRRAAFTANGKELASAEDDGSLIFWDPERRQPLGEPVKGHSARVASLATPFPRSPGTVSGAGLPVLASGSEDGTIGFWDAERRLMGQPLPAHEGPVLSLAFSRDGSLLASGGTDGKIGLWEVLARRPVGAPLVGHTRRVWSVAFSPDGKTLASASADGTVRLWDVATRKQRSEPLLGHRDEVLSVAFGRKNNLLASASYDRTIRFWDIGRGQPSGEPVAGHGSRVTALLFSPDGRTLTSAGEDGTVRLWDAEERRPLGDPLDGHGTWTFSLAFSPDGRMLASASDDSTLVLWEPILWSESLTTFRQRLCGVSGRKLSDTEWRQFLPERPPGRPCA